MSFSSAAVYEVTSEHARITQPNSAPDYFSIPWNDDFSTENQSIHVLAAFLDVSFFLFMTTLVVHLAFAPFMGVTFLQLLCFDILMAVTHSDSWRNGI